MSQAKERLAPYEQRLNALWERLVRAIGIHTVNVLMERAIWQASQKHPELALIQRTDEGLSYGAFEQAVATQTDEEVAAAFDDLTAELMIILARLLGREMAERLARELEERTSREAQAEAEREHAQ